MLFQVMGFSEIFYHVSIPKYLKCVWFHESYNIYYYYYCTLNIFANTVWSKKGDLKAME